jgi:hypothetical protein
METNRALFFIACLVIIIAAVAFYCMKAGIFCSRTDPAGPKIADTMLIAGCPGR